MATLLLAALCSQLVQVASAGGRTELAATAEAPVVGIYRPSVDPRAYLGAFEAWMQQAGAKTIVVEPGEHNVAWFLERTDGLLFPGGLTSYLPAFAKELIQAALRLNAEGGYYPVWGTCLGYQWLAEFAGGAGAMQFKHFDSLDLGSSLTFTEAAPGRIFRTANASLLHWLSTADVTYENHEDGIAVEHFWATEGLRDFFTVPATSTDRKGQRYVAVVEGKQWPVYGVQFHPEKVRFVPDNAEMAHIPRSSEAVAVSDFLAKFLYREARRSFAQRRGVSRGPKDEDMEATIKESRSSAQQRGRKDEEEKDVEATVRSWADICSAGAQELCSCQDLEAKGYLEVRRCKELHPAPAVQFCRDYGPCEGSAAAAVVFI